MTTSTPNLSLLLYDNGADTGLTFNAFRTSIAGTATTSNFYKIDTAVGTHISQIASLMNGKTAVLISAIRSSPGVYAKTGVTEVASYVSQMTIILKLDVTSTGATTLNINSLGAKSVMKINTAGTAVDITGGELVAGKYYLFIYDGTRFVWVGATVADQLYIAGTAGNFIKINSDNTLVDSTYTNTSFQTASTTIPYNGWIPITATATSATLDSPSFEISFNADMTALIGLGNRIKLTQTTTKYFIVTKVGAFSAGATIITCYGGTDYTLVASGTTAITNVFYSNIKAPFGFPLSPSKWMVSATSTANSAKASPAQNTWYGDTGLSATGISISVPIGVWYSQFKGVAEIVTPATAGSFGMKWTLSSTSSTESDSGYSNQALSVQTAVAGTIRFSITSPYRPITVTTKTPYYLNISTGQTGITTISIRGDIVGGTTSIDLTCAYL